MSDENSSIPSSVNSSPSSDQNSAISDQNLAAGSAAEVVSEIQADPNLSQAEKKKMIKELSIKFNGKEEKAVLPFEIPEEHAEFMRRQMQMAKLSQHSTQEKAALERDVASFLQELKKNPRKALSNPAYGVDLKKVAAEILEEELAESQKSPEQIEREKFEKERKEFLEEKQRLAEEKESEKKRQALEATANQYDLVMSESLDKFDIPKTPEAISLMAQYMSYEIKRGFEPDMDVIGQLVEEKLAQDYKKHLLSLPPEKRYKILGEEIFEEERKARVAKMKKAPQTAKQIQDVAKAQPKKEEPKKKQTFKERFGV